MTVVVTRGDAANLILPDGSVDLIVTSPPYFGLRSYTDGGAHYAEQIGDEATPDEYLDALMTCTREWMRVLKPSGSIFVNLGDKYDDDKSLMLLPQQYGIRARKEARAIVRSEIVWDKPNAMPTSVSDRVRYAHETIFHLVKRPDYFAATDEIRAINPDGSRGRIPGSVWSIPTIALRFPPELNVTHAASFPPDLVRPMVLGWSPREVCSACGSGRRPISERKTVFDKARDQTHAAEIASRGAARAVMSGGTARSTLNGVTTRSIIGYQCRCPTPTAPTAPGVVLDPFGGTGTTALVASVHGRIGISVDLSHDYTRLARWRTGDAKQRAKAGGSKPPASRAQRVAAPTTPLDATLALFPEAEISEEAS